MNRHFFCSHRWASLLVFLFSGLLFANTGKIRGKVVDAETKAPLFGANVVIEGTTMGAATKVNGEYLIINVPAGTYSMTVMHMGYAKLTVQNIVVAEGITTFRDFEMAKATLEGQEVVIMAERPLIDRSETSQMQRLSADDALTIENAVRLVKTQTGGFDASYNGKMSGIKGTGQDQFTNKPKPEFNTEEYAYIQESDFIPAMETPLTTFSADVDVAAYANVRRFLMGNRLPPPDAVRIEELVNYFNYDYPQPKGDHPLSMTLEYGPCPWNDVHKLVHIGLKGKTLPPEERKASNLVFLLDVSGSMNQPNKLPLLKMAFKLLVDQLSEKDRVAIVVYAGSSGLVLPATSGADKKTIVDALDRLRAGGSTAGGAGLQLAYQVAKDNLLKDGNNRVILATDGDFNVGISSTGDLTRFIKEKRGEGIFLTVLGFGMGNYKGHRLEQLADKGNGNHAYIDNLLEAKKVLVTEATSTLFTIAKDVKLQVEFNPAKVQSYRLLGYENRRLENRDFTDDKKDAGEMGAGHTVTALYEIIPAGTEAAHKEETLKYQQREITKAAKNSDEVLTLRIRYKAPDGDQSKEISTTLKDASPALKETSDNFRFSAAVAEFSLLLRKSQFIGTGNIEQVLDLAKGAKGQDPYGYRAEFITLAERMQLLMREDKQPPLH